MSSPAEVVADTFSKASTASATATSNLVGFMSALNAQAQQLAPTIEITFDTISSPGTASVAVETPTFVEPSPYASATADALEDAITARMAGGTGLPSSVETGIWDRARERELASMQANIDAATYDSEALGFALPPGVLNDGIRRAQVAYYDSAASAARDVAIKQAELEQSNLQKIFDTAVSFEGVLADARLKHVQTALESFRGQVELYRAGATMFEAQSAADAKLWEAQIKQNEAIATYTMNGQKINSDIIRANMSASADVAKVGAQVYAQLTAAAWGMIHASAGVQGSTSMQSQNSVSYNYSNDTSATVTPVTVAPAI